ncbi:MAG: hypothetical protein PHU53_04285 [Thermoplasmata archaeon]|nr:hypothetical protein [Thermoplasmata archaeon]
MGKKKGSSNSDSQESGNGNAAKLYDWISRGFVVDTLIEAVRLNDPAKIDEQFRDYSLKSARLESVRQKLATHGFNESHERFHEYSDCFNDPHQVERLESLCKSLEVDPRYKELRAELASINTNGFEAEARRIREMFDNNSDASEIDVEIKKLRKVIKEKFFEVAFEEAADLPAEKAPAPKPSPAAKFTAEIIFLLHRDGTLLSVKSRRPPTDLDKKLMSRMVMAIKEQMGRAFREGEHVHSLTYEGHTIILEDSVHVYAAIVVLGEAKPVMYKVILKALQIMEKKLASEFENWKGDRSRLENLDKYTSAIFQTLDKLN